MPRHRRPSAPESAMRRPPAEAEPSRGCSCLPPLPTGERADHVPPSARPRPRRCPPAHRARVTVASTGNWSRRCTRARTARADGELRPRVSACPSWATTLRAAVQPSLRKRRQIPQTPRPERPLVYERLSDAILVKRAKDGDKRALAALCERHAAKVERLAGHLLSDPEDARDAASRQRVRRCEPLHEDERLADDADPAREAGLAELRSELAGGLAEISPDQAKVVVLKDALDFSFAEIAEAVDMPIGTAKCYAHRARAGLRTRLKRDVA